jgi:hypothetical protein
VAALGDDSHSAVSRVADRVAEALGEGGQGQAIEALLDAALPAHAGDAQSLATVAAGSDGSSGLGMMAMHGYTLDHLMMQHLVHQDALPQA